MTTLVLCISGRLGREVAGIVHFWGGYHELDAHARISDVRASGGQRVVFTIRDAAVGRLVSEAFDAIVRHREAPPYGIPKATKRAATIAKAKVDAWVHGATS